VNVTPETGGAFLLGALFMVVVLRLAGQL